MAYTVRLDPSLSLSTNPDFLRIIQAARQEVKDGAVLTLEQMRKALL